MTRRRRLFTLACGLVLWLTSYAAYSADSFSVFDAHFRWASARFQPYLAGLRGWDRLKAQAIAESNLEPFAVSRAGARGLMQFMPRTWAECMDALNIQTSPFDAKASVYCGAWYMDRQRSIWNGRPRTELAKWYLSLAGYNAGAYNVIKAQRACSDALDWFEIQPCMHLITGRHSRETTEYVLRTKRIFNQVQSGYLRGHE